jgi:hypothetical protein
MFLHIYVLICNTNETSFLKICYYKILKYNIIVIWFSGFE